MKQHTSTFLRVGTLVLICLGVGTWAYLNGTATTTPIQSQHNPSLDSQKGNLDNNNSTNFADPEDPNSKYYRGDIVTGKITPTAKCLPPCDASGPACLATVGNFNLTKSTTLWTSLGFNCSRTVGGNFINATCRCQSKQTRNGTECVLIKNPLCETNDTQCKQGPTTSITNGIKCGGEPTNLPEKICCDAGYTLHNGDCVMLEIPNPTGCGQCNGTTASNDAKCSYNSLLLSYHQGLGTADPYAPHNQLPWNVLCNSVDFCEWDTSNCYTGTWSCESTTTASTCKGQYNKPGYCAGEIYDAGIGIYESCSHVYKHEWMKDECNHDTNGNCHRVAQIGSCSELSQSQCGSQSGCTRTDGVTTHTAVCSHGNCDPATKPNCCPEGYNYENGECVSTYLHEWTCFNRHPSCDSPQGVTPNCDPNKIPTDCDDADGKCKLYTARFYNTQPANDKKSGCIHGVYEEIADDNLYWKRRCLGNQKYDGKHDDCSASKWKGGSGDPSLVPSGSPGD